MSQSAGGNGGGQGEPAATGIGNGTGNNGNDGGGGASSTQEHTTTTYNNGMYTPDSQRTSTASPDQTTEDDATTSTPTAPRTTSRAATSTYSEPAVLPTSTLETTSVPTINSATLTTSAIVSSVAPSSILSSSVIASSMGLGIAGSTCSTGSDCQSGICRTNICTGIIASSVIPSSSVSTPSSLATADSDVSNSSTGSSSHTPAIVGAIVGALAFIVLLGFLIRFCMSRRSKERDYEPDVKAMQWPHGIEGEFVGTKPEESSYAMSQVGSGPDGISRSNTLAYGGSHDMHNLAHPSRARSQKDSRSAFATGAPEDAGWTRFQNSASTESLNRSPEYEQRNPMNRGVQLYDAPLASRSLRIANTADTSPGLGGNSLTVPGSTLARQNSHEIGTVSPYLQREFRGRLAEASAAQLESEANARAEANRSNQERLSRSDTRSTAPTNYYLPGRANNNNEDDSYDQYPKLAHMNRVSASIYPDEASVATGGGGLGTTQYAPARLDRSGTIMSTASSYYGNSPERPERHAIDTQSAYQDDAVRYSVQSFESDPEARSAHHRSLLTANNTRNNQNNNASQAWPRRQLGVVPEGEGSIR